MLGPDQPADAPQTPATRSETILRLQAEIAQLRQAVHSHEVIDQALGVIVTVGGVTPDEAWDVLRETSMHTNIKLRRVAESLITWVHSGQLPAEIENVLPEKLSQRTTSDTARAFRLVTNRRSR
jgi:hypothetical protein